MKISRSAPPKLYRPPTFELEEDDRAAKSAKASAGTRHLVAREHPFIVRFTHWLIAIVLPIMVFSGIQIFRAFPSFGPKIPQKNFWMPPTSLGLGGWLGGGIQWHFTFMWAFMGAGIVYVLYEAISGHYRQLLFMPRDIAGVWPMVKHYFFFREKPALLEPYNPLQKLAYTACILLGALAMASGLALYKPVQFGWIAFLMGGFRLVRVWHFAATVGFVLFIPGHLIMVAIHGWANFWAMFTGWKKDPEYIQPPPAVNAASSTLTPTGAPAAPGGSGPNPAGG